jgi:hypothetical protein
VVFAVLERLGVSRQVLDSTDGGAAEWNPMDQQVQADIRLLFQTFLRTGTATATAKYLRDQKLLFPKA